MMELYTPPRVVSQLLALLIGIRVVSALMHGFRIFTDILCCFAVPCS
jgi:hypothetical protein